MNNSASEARKIKGFIAARDGSIHQRSRQEPIAKKDSFDGVTIKFFKLFDQMRKKFVDYLVTVS